MIGTGARREETLRFRAMATDVTVRVVDPRPTAAEALKAAEDVFHRVERACTRFDPDSSLMRANAAPREWHQVPDELFAAVTEAHRAHVATEGRFDPRVLSALQSAGYDRTLPFSSEQVHLPDAPATPAPARGRWRPGLDTSRGAIRLGPEPIDLGGIGKGLAVRWATAALADSAAGYLVEAGGDCVTGGQSPDGTGWRIGVEDPHGGDGPLAVLAADDAGIATSSVRIRRWQAGGREVHHLIDPATGAASTTGLVAVTVRASDPAWAEVWSKALFVAGRGALRALADEHELAALWVDDDGFVGVSRAMQPYVLWRRPENRPPRLGD